MNFEKIEKAYELILENSQLIENEIKTHIYDALIEQNAYYLGADGAIEQVLKNNSDLYALNLSKEEWRRAFQFIFIKVGQTEKLQANHQFTPDSIAFIMLFLMEQLHGGDSLDVIEIGSGTGNLAQTLLNNSLKKIDYLGLELDDLLIDLSASIAEVMKSSATFLQEDAVRPQVLKESDIIISDLPVGYYPNDEIASRYQVASAEGHTYAHHLLMEQSLKYLKKNGFAIFLAPSNLLNSSQSDLLKKWLKDYAQLRVVLTLPDSLFGNQANAKSIIVLQKNTEKNGETFVYPLTDLQSPQTVQRFMEEFKKWKQDNVFS
ncbi:class I SAM-dependent methyltransferase [Streptococcus porcinus]|uniref:Class I SAM-dependent methyltransferase n=1 Tax=Streptococcus porcinus TaxID=1340 RepID=A0A7V9WRU6_STRPO|nr:class I SAM-dependent methyltransferase [Streptococcus porcinus]MBA2795683.1 class I SAM-dependent methyltransferase [Streptococcus porcinus]